MKVCVCGASVSLCKESVSEHIGIEQVRERKRERKRERCLVYIRS